MAQVRSAIFIVHEFVTDKTTDVRHAKNAADYRAFRHRLAGHPLPDAQTTLHGPFTVTGAPLFEKPPRLLVGKSVTNRRAAMTGKHMDRITSTINRASFREIVARRKRIEYRAIKPYRTKRLARSSSISTPTDHRNAASDTRGHRRGPATSGKTLRSIDTSFIWVKCGT
jgi:hypothetical protein